MPDRSAAGVDEVSFCFYNPVMDLLWVYVEITGSPGDGLVEYAGKFIDQYWP